ncbi:hypothetical protein M3O96_04655, partial [Aquiflexum sp. TKW24L]|uniref:hypothetical protein n=1 Tax=Aquiflexum sp. TKW24L TaxID=2942212 RepID=UPI0020C0D88D
KIQRRLVMKRILILIIWINLILRINVLGNPVLIPFDSSKYVSQSKELKEIKIVQTDEPQDLDSTVQFKGHFSHRNLLTPTGKSMEKGQFEYQNIYLLFNQFNVGITDRFTASGAFLWAPGIFSNEIYFGYQITPRYSFGKIGGNYNFNLGATVGKWPDSESAFYGVFSNHTVGNDRNNLTFGFGFGDSFKAPTYYYSNQVDQGFFQRPFFNLGASLQFSKKMGMVIDNLYVNRNFDKSLFGGIVFRGHFSRFYVELGLGYVADLEKSYYQESQVSFLPMFGFGVNNGKRK